jgi:protein-L-isoaspartate(D-aspartate) O-methyltransferase
MNNLINDLIKHGYLRTDLVIDAFSEINRAEFVPKELEQEAYADIAFPVGFGQTISQPRTVVIMFELLQAERGDNILDVGSGSGWTTALLGYIAGRNGHVTAIERIQKLMEWGKSNVEKYNFVQKGITEFNLGDGSLGFEKNAPYDKILVSASAIEVPEALKKQLKIGGRMVIPIKNDLWSLKKIKEDEFKIEKFPGFIFVPLVT